jgi:hypothetical protein
MRGEITRHLFGIAKMSWSHNNGQRGNTALPEIKGTDDTDDDVWAWDGCL